MNFTSNLKQGEYLDPRPLINLLAQSVYEALLTGAGSEDIEANSNDDRELSIGKTQPVLQPDQIN